MSMGVDLAAAYRRLPQPMQDVAVSLYGAYWRRRRFGGVFRRELDAFRSRTNWRAEQWEQYQQEQLRRLLVHAYREVPFYREKYGRAGIREGDLWQMTLARLPELPFLEKDELRRFGSRELLADCRERGTFFSSSGSTGTPTRIYYSPRFHQRWSAAFEVRIREWAGVNRFMARGMIGGRRVVPDGDSTGPFYRHNRAERQTYFSAYHIGPATVADYVEGMVKGGVEYMTGYAMSNYLLAREIEKAGLRPPPLRAVITSSESLTPRMRETFRRVYGCRTFDSYSGVEACGLISETPDGFLVNNPDVGILEVLDPGGQPVGPGGTGEVVSTGLLNFDQPLIRYRIGDMVSLSSDPHAADGLDMPVIERIEGRLEDRVVGPDGRVMVRFHGIFVEIGGLLASQVVQEAVDRVRLRLVVEQGYDPVRAERTMTRRLQSQLGTVLRVEFEYVRELPKTSNGKVKAVVSNLGVAHSLSL